MNLLPDRLRADSSAGHCWSSMVANFSWPNCAVAGSSDKSTSSSEDITLSAAGHYKYPLTNTDVLAQNSHKTNTNTRVQFVWSKTPARHKEHWGLVRLEKNKKQRINHLLKQQRHHRQSNDVYNYCIYKMGNKWFLQTLAGKFTSSLTVL